ncbi:hypothetical protein LTR70_010780, partial [Exophiala xenobiotica]
PLTVPDHDLDIFQVHGPPKRVEGKLLEPIEHLHRLPVDDSDDRTTASAESGSDDIHKSDEEFAETDSDAWHSTDQAVRPHVWFIIYDGWDSPVAE